MLMQEEAKKGDRRKARVFVGIVITQKFKKVEKDWLELQS
ncbi:conserved hypothetical protein [Xenorhabdus bovienii str. puntauvense]|uniref:Uncharacterized protein n=3 Tax=Xenorhabdus bovienii TaxID=40576 RepID=A0A0B6X6R4_XENBV|nr:conserved hypothetical protein [Xenorhabdus bovienii str. feltiae France]CDG98453.1 conserved hypothetical protein [Xenorhabdus bovienii str. puntauvense]CDH23272.1 conserved hypothetical protein [Xenorhabdus bovienii str. kraussei Becker Underwood]CDM88816.1 conserved protein of unknown function [Xenorhabdus bovienii]